MKQRNIVTCIILSIVTCGIYSIYWFIQLNDETNQLNGEPGTSGGMAFLLSIVTCGIYMHYWHFKQGEKIAAIKAKRGTGDGSNSSIIYLVLGLVGFSIVGWAMMQNEINNFIESDNVQNTY